MLKMDWGCHHLINREGFINAKTVLEIGGGSFERTYALAENYPDKTFYAVDFDYSSQAIKNTQKYCHLPNVNIIKENSTKKIFADNLFDFSFSIAVGEHIAELELFINEMTRILKHNGEYFFVQSPSWTSSRGHHFKHWVPDIRDMLSGYKHLLYSDKEMRLYLQNYKSLPFSIDEAIFAIYKRNDLSRLSMNETKAIFNDSLLKIDYCKDLEDEEIFFDEPAATKVIDKYQGKYSLEDIKTKGSIISCINTKGIKKDNKFTITVRKIKGLFN